MDERNDGREPVVQPAGPMFPRRAILASAFGFLLTFGSCAVVVTSRGAESPSEPPRPDVVAGITVTPSPTPTPSPTVGPSVDESDDVDESDEGSDEPALPDLLVSGLTREAVVVVNAGSGPAGAFSVTVSGTSFSIPGLLPGASTVRAFECRGETLTAEADASDVVAESNELNNERTEGPFDCDVDEGPLPDLVVNSLTSTRVSIVNGGDAPAGPFSVTVSLSSFAFSGLRPGASTSATFTCREGSLTATADARGRVAESDETNNSRTAGPFSCPEPDLVVTRLARDSVTVANLGDARAPATAVSVTGNGELAIPGLDPGAAFDGSFPCTEGSLTARADPGQLVREDDETNNATTAGPFTCPKPDLVVTGITNTSVTVRNQGDADAGASLVSVTGAGNLPVGPLPAGASRTLDFTCTEGSVTANVDPDDQVAESDEQNNARTVTGLACPKPDLIVTVLTRSSVTVKNQGNANAGPFEIRVTGLQATLKVASLAAGASLRIDFGACLDGTFTATADSSNTVDESNENNNSATENNLSCID